MTNHEDKLVTHLQQMKENDLSHFVLLRLFRSFGYDEVEFHGGPDEQGKDLVCWRRDELDDVELGVVQVKRYKPTRKASDIASFSEVVTQLSQCVETRVPYTDGNSYLPTAIYFVTPYAIDTRTLNTRFAKVAALRQFRVKIINGPTLARLIRQRIPTMAAELLGSSEGISQAIAPQLSNQILMNALGFQATRHIKEFYTDIDIAVGHVHARYFLSSDFHPKRQTFDIDEQDWHSLKDVLRLIQSVFAVNLIPTPSSELDQQTTQKKTAWEEWKEENRHLNACAQQNAHDLSELREKIGTVAERSASARRKRTSSTLLAIRAAIAAIDSGEDLSRVSPTKDADFDDEVLSLLDGYRSIRWKHVYSERDAAAHRAKEPSITVMIDADGAELAGKLRAARVRIRDEATQLGKRRRPTATELKRFIDKCQSTFRDAAVILRNPAVAAVVGLTATNEPISTFTRLSFPIDLVFDTGLNVAVLGEAGAGKSTALQIYAFRHYDRPEREKLVIFAPLNHVVRFAPTVSSQSAARPLDVGLVAFLRSLGTSYSIEEFQGDAKRGGVILLDSIDEAFAYAPWVIDSLVAFAEKYPQLQLITSSRVSGAYAEHIPFVGSRLMPFTDAQQIQFVSNWFGDDPDGHIATICDHLNEHGGVADVVRNPLLATAMCALQEHNVPLPTSEIRLYQEWLSLLVGVLRHSQAREESGVN